MKFILLLFFTITFKLHASYIGVENNFRYIGKIQTDAEGTTNFLEFSPGIVAATSMPAPLLNNTWFYPGAAIFFPSRSEDELYTKWHAELNFHLFSAII